VPTLSRVRAGTLDHFRVAFMAGANVLVTGLGQPSGLTSGILTCGRRTRRISIPSGRLNESDTDANTKSVDSISHIMRRSNISAMRNGGAAFRRVRWRSYEKIGTFRFWTRLGCSTWWGRVSFSLSHDRDDGDVVAAVRWASRTIGEFVGSSMRC